MQQERTFIVSIIIICGLIVSASAWLFLSTIAPLLTESPIRMIIGAFMIFIVPGLLWGEVLGFRARHILEVLALSAAVSFMIEIFLLPISLIIGAKIDFWVLSVLAIGVVGVLFNVRKLLAGRQFCLMTGIMSGRNRSHAVYLSMSQIAIVVIIAILSYGTYRWGEDMFDLGREKFLQTVYVRYYFDMPLQISMIGLIKGVPVPNFIHFWEFLMAGWAKLIGMDPLPLFCRARCVVPLLGFSGIYLFIRHLFVNRTKRELVFWIVLILAAGFFMIYSPSSLDVAKNDPTWGAFCFMGINHHADTAVEILLPLGLALLLACMRQPNTRNYLLLVSFLGATFLWHVREFLQLGILEAIFLIALLIYPLSNRMRSLRRWGVVISAFMLVALAFVFLSAFLIPHNVHGYEESLVKKTALAYAFSWENVLSVRNYFKFPTIYLLFGWGNLDPAIGIEGLNKVSGINYFAPLIAGAFLIPLIVKWGLLEDRRLTLWFILTWLLCLCWNFSMLIIMFFSYGEIFVWPVRHVFLFAYLLVGLSLFVATMKLYEWQNWRLKGRIIVVLLCLLCAGYYFNLWLQSVMMNMNQSAAKVLSVIIWVSFIYLLAGKLLWRRKESKGCYSIPAQKKGSAFAAMLGMSCMVLFPVIGNDLVSTFHRCMTYSRPDLKWFSHGNIFGLSKELLWFIRGLPPQQLFMVDPMGKGALCLYAPQYLDVLPAEISWILAQKEAVDNARSDRHVLFNSRVPKLVGDLERREQLYASICEYVDARKIDYIFVEKKYYVSLHRFFETYNSHFAIVFDSPSNGELIVRVQRK